MLTLSQHMQKVFPYSEPVEVIQMTHVVEYALLTLNNVRKTYETKGYDTTTWSDVQVIEFVDSHTRIQEYSGSTNAPRFTRADDFRRGCFTVDRVGTTKEGFEIKGMMDGVIITMALLPRVLSRGDVKLELVLKHRSSTYYVEINEDEILIDGFCLVSTRLNTSIVMTDSKGGTHITHPACNNRQGLSNWVNRRLGRDTYVEPFIFFNSPEQYEDYKNAVILRVMLENSSEVNGNHMNVSDEWSMWEEFTNDTSKLSADEIARRKPFFIIGHVDNDGKLNEITWSKRSSASDRLYLNKPKDSCTIKVKKSDKISHADGSPLSTEISVTHCENTARVARHFNSILVSILKLSGSVLRDSYRGTVLTSNNDQVDVYDKIRKVREFARGLGFSEEVVKEFEQKIYAEYIED